MAKLQKTKSHKTSPSSEISISKCEFTVSLLLIYRDYSTVRLHHLTVPSNTFDVTAIFSQCVDKIEKYFLSSLESENEIQMQLADGCSTLLFWSS
jgi:hypothetical protein